MGEEIITFDEDDLTKKEQLVHLVEIIATDNMFTSLEVDSKHNIGLDNVVVGKRPVTKQEFTRTGLIRVDEGGVKY